MWPHAWAGGAGGKAELCDRWQHSVGTALDTHLLMEAPCVGRLGWGYPTFTCRRQDQKLSRPGDLPHPELRPEGGPTGPPAAELVVRSGALHCAPRGGQCAGTGSRSRLPLAEPSAWLPPQAGRGDVFVARAGNRRPGCPAHSRTCPLPSPGDPPGAQPHLFLLHKVARPCGGGPR